ncbi:MAG: type VI secretion system lipoprotein TssJ [Alphaproteobacteria bacterium]|nr:type VI secretion system lipoprotein TssJ [Alphaproteobacteria bacterium]
MFLFLLTCAFLLTGCSLFTDPNKLSLSVCGNADLNPDVNGQPSPVDVLLFQLKNSQHFEGEEFLELYQNSKKSLGPDLIAQTRFVIKPNECMKKDLTLDPLTKFIGIVVAFQNIDKAHYKQVFIREKIPDTGLNLKLTTDDLMVAETEASVSDQKETPNV